MYMSHTLCLTTYDSYFAILVEATIHILRVSMVEDSNRYNKE